MSKSNAITVSRSKRGTTIKASGHAAQALFDVITKPRHVPVRTVHFEDHGQDFLEWDLDSRNCVIDSRPFQAFVWRGCTVQGEVVPGRQLVFLRPGDTAARTVKYPVTKVVAIVPATR